MDNINNWIKGVKIILWVSLIAFGVTLVNTTGLLFNADTMFANVHLKTNQTTALSNGAVIANAGTLEFKSDSILDRVLFKHVYGYHDFLQSLFTFTVCLLLLLTVNKLDIKNPFTSEVNKRIMSIGILYIAYGIIAISAAAYMTYRVESLTRVVSGSYLTFRDDFSNIKIGAFILILSLVYRVGVKFQEENRLTI